MIRRLRPDAAANGALCLSQRCSSRTRKVSTAVLRLRGASASFPGSSRWPGAAAVAVNTNAISRRCFGSDLSGRMTAAQLCCPQCGSSLERAETLAESAANSKEPASKTPTEAAPASAAFKEGDVVKCSGCNLHFAVKSASNSNNASRPAGATGNTSAPVAEAVPSTPTYSNAAAAAALSSLSSSSKSLLAGNMQTRGTTMGSDKTQTTTTPSHAATAAPRWRRMNGAFGSHDSHGCGRILMGSDGSYSRWGVREAR